MFAKCGLWLILNDFYEVCTARCMLSGFSFPYKSEALAAEIILILILAGLEAVRIFLGMFYISFSY